MANEPDDRSSVVITRKGRPVCIVPETGSDATAGKRIAPKGIWLGMLIGLILLLAGVGYAVVVAHVKTRGPDCPSRLTCIYLALQTYAHEHGGEYPPDLYPLAGGKYVDAPERFSCPSAPNHTPKDFKTRSDFLTGYLYFYHPGLKPASPDADRTVVLCDKLGNHRNGGNVVYASGRVDHLTGSDWHRKAGLDHIKADPVK